MTHPSERRVLVLNPAIAVIETALARFESIDCPYGEARMPSWSRLLDRCVGKQSAHRAVGGESLAGSITAWAIFLRFHVYVACTVPSAAWMIAG
jgi:hypothetical protein